MTARITCPHGQPITDASACPICAAAPGSETATLPPAAVEAPTLPPAPGGDVPPATERVAVPGYEILGELGRGGMGVVYKARQAKLGRLVALKMILSGGHAGAADLARFRTEAEAIARLQHPNIVQIHEVGDHAGLPYFSLEFCAGGSLEKKLAGTPLPPKDAAALVETLARAMQAAHEKGVIHRDLKPANVLLAEDGTPKVTDFGLAKKLDPASPVREHGDNLTASGAVMGTPSYMAPEQAGMASPGRKPGESAVGPGADVYALGAILYECLTGRPPFRGPTAMDTIMQVVTDEPVAVRQLQPQVPADVETICLKCLRKEAGRRYASAAGLAEDLRRFREGRPIAARPVRPPERLWRWCRRNPVVAALVATSAAAALGLAAAFAALWYNAERRAEVVQDLNTAQVSLAEARGKVAAAGEELTEKQGRLEQIEAAAAQKQGEVDRLEADDRAARERFRRVGYLTDMHLARLALDANDLPRVRELLDKQRPTEGAADLRGFEWDYLHGPAIPTSSHLWPTLPRATGARSAMSLPMAGRATVRMENISQRPGPIRSAFTTPKPAESCWPSEIPRGWACLAATGNPA